MVYTPSIQNSTTTTSRFRLYFSAPFTVKVKRTAGSPAKEGVAEEEEEQEKSFVRCFVEEKAGSPCNEDLVFQRAAPPPLRFRDKTENVKSEGSRQQKNP